VMEYCDKPLPDGTASPYDETESWPRKPHEAGTMDWMPITISKASGEVTTTVLRLATKDGRVAIICHTPMATGLVEGRMMTPTDTKCDILIKNFPYSLSCPAGKTRGLALVTSVMTRYDNGMPQVRQTKDANVVPINNHKMTLKFQRFAGYKVRGPAGQWQMSGDIPVRIKISKPHWVPSYQFQSHRHYQFSFGLSSKEVNSISSGEVMWDPQLSSHFKQEAVAQLLRPTTSAPKPVTLMSLMGWQANGSARNTPGVWVLTILACALPFVVGGQ